MTIRRLAISLVLLLFAILATGIIIGLDDTARGQLLTRLPGGPAPDPGSPRPTAAPATPTPTIARPSPTPVPRTTSRAPQPKLTSSPKPATTSTPRTTPRAHVTPVPRSDQPGSGKPRRGKVVYLTFDDGPGPYTPQVLAILRTTGSTATFFQLGVNARGQGRLQAAIRAQGSTIGNHTGDHADLTRLSGVELRRQIADGPRSRCVRPPYGATNRAVRAAIKRAGARQVLWTVDTLDWQRPGAARLARIGKSAAVRDGGIILMHDGGGDRRQTVAALPQLIANLQARGFAVRAIPDCRP